MNKNNKEKKKKKQKSGFLRNSINFYAELIGFLSYLLTTFGPYVTYYPAYISHHSRERDNIIRIMYHIYRMGNSWNSTKINIELLKATTAQVIKWDSVQFRLLHSKHGPSYGFPAELLLLW